jgi:hypothetical protein
MRKVVIAKEAEMVYPTGTKEIEKLRAMTLAFEHTMRNFDVTTDNIAIAFNMKQKSTNMEKEKIAERLQKHTNWIKHRKERIKVMEARKKKTDNPDTKIRLSQAITKAGERIKKHQEAIKYYKLLASLKPKNKENPLKRNEHTL